MRRHDLTKKNKDKDKDKDKDSSLYSLKMHHATWPPARAIKYTIFTQTNVSPLLLGRNKKLLLNMVRLGWGYQQNINISRVDQSYPHSWCCWGPLHLKCTAFLKLTLFSPFFFLSSCLNLMGVASALSATTSCLILQAAALMKRLFLR